MNITIQSTGILWKSNVIGTPTRRIPDHYYGRNITAVIDGDEHVFRFSADELKLDALEDEMIVAIEHRVTEEAIKEDQEDNAE